jgi:hypothetical protein
MTDYELMKQVMENICGAKLCEINSMSSRQEMLRLLDKAITALRDRLAQTELVQVSPLEFVTAVLEKEHLVGKPIMWAQWPNEEKNGG